MRKLALLCVAVLLATLALAEDVKITKGPLVEHTSANSAIVAWSTNVSASTVVKYGTDQSNLSQTAQAPWGGLTHRVTIKNLEPGKTYYYQVDSGQGQGSGGNAMSQVASFTTQGNSAQASAAQPGQQYDRTFNIVNGPTLEQVTDTGATVAWTTDRPASSVVKYGTDANNLNQTAEEPWGQTTHRVHIKNLQPGTQYYFSVHSAQGKNAPGQAADTQPQPFTTKGGANASNGNNSDNRFRITNGPVLERVADTNAQIAWSTNLPSSAIVKYGTSPSNLNQTAQEAWGQTNHRVELKNLQPGTKYYFSVHSAQGKNTPGQSADAGPMPFTTAQAGQSASVQQH